MQVRVDVRASVFHLGLTEDAAVSGAIRLQSSLAGDHRRGIER